MFDEGSHGSRGAVQLENEFFRVTQWTIEPGGAIPMHRHEYEYVVVPATDGTIVAVAPSGEETESRLIAGASYTRPAGSEHRVENRDAVADVVFVEVERLA